MTDRWLARVPHRSRRAAARLRLHPGVEAAEAESGLWLRGKRPIPPEARSIGGFRAVEEDPSEGASAELDWRSAREVFRVALPEVTPTTPIDDRVPLTLVPTPGDTPSKLPALPMLPMLATLPTLVRTDAPSWVSFALESSVHCLQGLRFAASRSGRVFVEGASVASLGLPGDRFVVEHGVAWPVGQRLAPLHRPDWLAQVLRLAPEEVAVIEEGGHYVRLGPPEFVAASRSAVRATWPFGFEEDRLP